jgi:hypothetical protein
MAVVAVNPAPTYRIGARRGDRRPPTRRSRYRRARVGVLLTFAVLRVLLVLPRFNGVSTSLRSRLAPAVLLIRA